MIPYICAYLLLFIPVRFKGTVKRVKKIHTRENVKKKIHAKKKVKKKIHAEGRSNCDFFRKSEFQKSTIERESYEKISRIS